MVKSIQTAGYNGVPTVGGDFYVKLGFDFFCFFYRLRAYVVHFAIELYTTTEIILFLNLLWEMNAKFLEMAIV